MGVCIGILEVGCGKFEGDAFFFGGVVRKSREEIITSFSGFWKVEEVTRTLGKVNNNPTFGILEVGGDKFEGEVNLNPTFWELREVNNNLTFGILEVGGGKFEPPN